MALFIPGFLSFLSSKLFSLKETYAFVLKKRYWLNILMLLALHVYSSWNRLQSLATRPAFSFPICWASCCAMDSVDSSVPYTSKARTMVPVSERSDSDVIVLDVWLIWECCSYIDCKLFGGLVEVRAVCRSNPYDFGYVCR